MEGETRDRKIQLNVGGSRFVTYRSTLSTLPDTRLSDLDELDVNYDPEADEFFFDRNPVMFDCILNYYRTGELHFPSCMCGPSIKAELEYWGLDENCISACCWKAYSAYEEEKKTMLELSKTLGVTVHAKVTQASLNATPSRASMRTEPDNSEGWWSNFRRKLWKFLEKPQSSKAAKGWAIFIFLLILTSIMVVVMETHPAFRVPKESYIDTNGTMSTKINNNNNNGTNDKIQMYKNTDLHPALVIIDGICISVFSLDLLTRLIICPSKLKFFKSIFNIIDFLCVIPLLLVYFFQLIQKDLWGSGGFFVIIAYLSLSSVLRVFRLFKLARHYRGLRILQLAVRSSLKELLLLFLLISMGMLVFSTLIYFAEFNQKSDKFPNIPIGFWWSIITMTTVGYGDRAPTDGLGYLVGGICAISGMLITGLPIPIIASNFNHYYNYARLTAKMAAKPLPQRIWQGYSRRSSTASSSRAKTVRHIVCGEDPGFSRADTSTPSGGSVCSHATTSMSSDRSLLNKSTARLSYIGVTGTEKSLSPRSPLAGANIRPATGGHVLGRTDNKDQLSPKNGRPETSVHFTDCDEPRDWTSLSKQTTTGSQLAMTKESRRVTRCGNGRTFSAGLHVHASQHPKLGGKISPRNRVQPVDTSDSNQASCSITLNVPRLSISNA